MGGRASLFGSCCLAVGDWLQGSSLDQRNNSLIQSFYQKVFTNTENYTNPQLKCVCVCVCLLRSKKLNLKASAWERKDRKVSEEGKASLEGGLTCWYRALEPPVTPHGFLALLA